jgi:hypothetical protein
MLFISRPAGFIEGYMVSGCMVKGEIRLNMCPNTGNSGVIVRSSGIRRSDVNKNGTPTFCPRRGVTSS